MNNSLNFINMEGLKFFGRVNASISHELKNILAIISETAGFLNDLTQLAKQGKELKLSLLETCSNSIEEEIQRGFTTIKQMNRFAHSVDIPVKEIDILETLDLIIKLSSFLSFSSNVQIKNNNKEIQSILTCPFLLQDLIYQILCLTYEAAGQDSKIHIDLDTKDDNGIHLIFSGPAQFAQKSLVTQKIQKTADLIGVELTQPSPMEIDIYIPWQSTKIDILAQELLVY